LIRGLQVIGALGLTVLLGLSGIFFYLIINPDVVLVFPFGLTFSFTNCLVMSIICLAGSVGCAYLVFRNYDGEDEDDFDDVEEYESKRKVKSKGKVKPVDSVSGYASKVSSVGVAAKEASGPMRLACGTKLIDISSGDDFVLKADCLVYPGQSGSVASEQIPLSNSAKGSFDEHGVKITFGDKSHPEQVPVKSRVFFKPVNRKGELS